MKKLIILILVILIVGRYLLSAGYEGSLIGVIMGSVGGPVLILLVILWLLKPKKHKTGIDEIDKYL